MAVLVLDRRKKPLMPCSERRTRVLLARGRARIHRMVPFTIRLVDRLQEEPVLTIQATGRGSYQRTRLTRHGFPRGYLTRNKSAFGFQTGDLVRAFVTSGKKAGRYLGRVAIRATGSFNIQTATGLVQGIPHRFCTLIQRADGYGYALTQRAFDIGEAGALSLPGLNPRVSRVIG